MCKALFHIGYRVLLCKAVDKLLIKIDHGLHTARVLWLFHVIVVQNIFASVAVSGDIPVLSENGTYRLLHRVEV